MTADFVRPPTAQEAVLTELRRLLVTGELAPGFPVRQEAVAELLGVSRVPVREALKVLEGEGHVKYAAHRGYVVSELSVEDLVEVYRLRELLEAEAIRVAVPQLTDADVEAIAAAARQVDAAGRTGDLAGMTASNRDFHFQLFDAAGMPRLSRTLRQLWDATDVYRSVYFAGAGNRRHVKNEHAALVDALRAHDVRQSIALQKAHRDHSVSAVTAAIVHGSSG